MVSMTVFRRIWKRLMNKHVAWTELAKPNISPAQCVTTIFSMEKLLCDSVQQM